MIAYLDSSVLLRSILGESGGIRDLHLLEPGISSALTRVECLRALDRMRHGAQIEPTVLALRQATVLDWLARIQVVDVSTRILQRASAPLPLPVRTLDAIHLITAIEIREEIGADVVFCTHDRDLSLAAGASGFPVLGV